jgi:VWFA-related protein
MEVEMKPSVRRRPTSRWTLGGMGALLAAAGLATLVASPARGSAELPVFPSQIEMVTVDAVIVDANGTPVPSLNREDFTVLENGVRQEIASFEAISVKGPAAVAAPSAAAVRSVNVATNVAAPGRRATFLVVFDDLHLSAVSAKQARTALEQFLREAAHEGDRVTIVSTATRGAWSGTLPEDRDDLLAFAARLKGRIVTTGSDLMTDYEAMRIAEYNDTELLDRVMGRYYQRSECSTLSPCDAKVLSDARAVHGKAKGEREGTLVVIERALEGLARLRGRKAVVLLSEGFVHDDPQERIYSRTVAAAQRTNAALYFVDVRGIVGLSVYNSAEAPIDGEPTNPKLPERASGVMLANRSRDVKELLTRATVERPKGELKIGVETIADDTGGFVLRGTNDLAPGLGRIAAESRVYYLLGYHPTNTSRDGSFRRIDVRVARAGLEVRARKGYDAPGAEGKESRKASRQETPDPLAQAFEASADVPLRLATYALEPAPERRTRVLAVTEIDVSGLRTEEQAGRRVGHLELRLEAIPRDGGESRVHTVAMDADVPAAASLRGTGVWRPIRLEFELPSGVYRVRASARDTSSGVSGVVAQRLEVTDPTAFRISTPILSDAIAPPSGPSPSPEPAPLAHQQFAADSGHPLLCQFEVFGAARNPTTKRAQVTVQLTLADDKGRAIGAAAPVPMAQSKDGRLRQLIALPLDRLAAGQYALTLVVEDRVAGARDEWQSSFVIEAGTDSVGGSAAAPAIGARAATVRLP